MEIIVGELLPYYYEQDFLQSFIWYERVSIAELVYKDLSIGKVNMNCRGPLWGQLTKRGLLHVIDNPLPKRCQDDESLLKLSKELLGEEQLTYHSIRDLSELITVIDKGLPILEKPNPYYPKSPTIHTYLAKALGNSPFLKRKTGKMKRVELARDLVLPRFEIATVDDIFRYREMKSVRNLREEIQEVASVCAKGGKTINIDSVRELLTEINSRLYRDIYSKKPGLPRTILEETALWLGESALSAIISFPVPLSPVLSVVKNLWQGIKDKNSWLYLLLSMSKYERDR